MEKTPFSPEVKNQDFDEKFKNGREVLDIFGTPFEIVDVSPDDQKTSIPVLIAPGWTEDTETFKEGMRVLVEKGRRVISFEHPRHGSEMEDIDEDLKKLYPVEELRKALTILAILDQKHIDSADVVAHSEGGINTAIAAVLETEKFHRIVFANSAGIIGDDSFFKLTSRFGKFSLSEVKELLYSDDLKRQTNIMDMMKRLGTYITSNFPRAIKESIAMSNIQIQDMIEYLHEKGVGITILTSDEDKAFPPERVKDVIGQDHVDNFISMRGGHMEINKSPKEYMSKIDEIFSEDEIAKV